MKIYTCTGDKGRTALVGGQRVAKDSTRLEAYGTMDELASHLGLLAATLPSCGEAATIAWQIERIQCNIFNICTFLATDTSATSLYPSARLSQEEVTMAEQWIDDINATLPDLNCFILPGGCATAAQCHICRTVCRRAERRMVTLFTETYPDMSTAGDEVTAQARIMLCYVNRMSDYLFVLARKLNFIAGTDEKKWQNTCHTEKK